ncbi:hypothetical protein [Nonlabens ulvanivorans]|uniref:hypothetical protein n=1 Tax=Nonlabens ulvanivorans TaxID=906888 RepID=UPI00329717C3
MKFVVKLILIIGLCYLLQLVLPFWIVAVAAFLVNLVIKTNGWSSFFSGFFAVAILWFIVASGIDSRTDSILTERIAQLFSLSSFLLTAITAIVGGLVAGMGGLTARMLHTQSKKSKSKYYS